MQSSCHSSVAPNSSSQRGYDQRMSKDVKLADVPGRNLKMRQSGVDASGGRTLLSWGGKIDGSLSANTCFGLRGTQMADPRDAGWGGAATGHVRWLDESSSRATHWGAAIPPLVQRRTCTHGTGRVYKYLRIQRYWRTMSKLLRLSEKSAEGSLLIKGTYLGPCRGGIAFGVGPLVALMPLHHFWPSGLASRREALRGRRSELSSSPTPVIMWVKVRTMRAPDGLMMVSLEGLKETKLNSLLVAAKKVAKRERDTRAVTEMFIRGYAGWRRKHGGVHPDKSVVINKFSNIHQQAFASRRRDVTTYPGGMATLGEVHLAYRDTLELGKARRRVAEGSGGVELGGEPVFKPRAGLTSPEAGKLLREDLVKTAEGASPKAIELMRSNPSSPFYHWGVSPGDKAPTMEDVVKFNQSMGKLARGERSRRKAEKSLRLVEMMDPALAREEDRLVYFKDELVAARDAGIWEVVETSVPGGGETSRVGRIRSVLGEGGKVLRRERGYFPVGSAEAGLALKEWNARSLVKGKESIIRRGLLRELEAKVQGRFDLSLEPVRNFKGYPTLDDAGAAVLKRGYYVPLTSGGSMWIPAGTPARSAEEKGLYLAYKKEGKSGATSKGARDKEALVRELRGVMAG